MKAAVFTKYGPPEVLSIQDIPKPIPNANEVLIRVHAATINRTDSGFRSAKYFITRLFSGLVKPKWPVAGSEFAGQIEAVGAGVQNYKIGDKVFGFDDTHPGGHAEYKAEAADGPMAKMPDSYSYAQAAPAGEGATYALNIIEAANIQKGQKVLVYGASGAIGSAAVQILKHLEADVTAVCGTKNVGLVKSLGADRVIDYQQEDFTQIEDRFDFILDAVGKSSYVECKKLFSPKGSYRSTELGPYGQNIYLAIWFAVTGSRKVVFPVPKVDKAHLERVRELLESGAFKPVVDRTYPLDDIVDATKYVESGQKTGNVVIEIV